jgi:hypothetical protein
MTCDELTGRLAERALSPETPDEELEAHLGSCATCRERAAVLDGALRRLPAIVAREAQPLSPGLRAKILEGPRRPRWGRVISVGALLAAGVSAALLLSPAAPPPAAPVFHAPPEPATIVDHLKTKEGPDDGTHARDTSPVAAVSSAAPTPLEDASQVVACVKLRADARDLVDAGVITSDQCNYVVNLVSELDTRNATAAVASNQIANARRQLAEFQLQNENDRLMKNAQSLQELERAQRRDSDSAAGTRSAK